MSKRRLLLPIPLNRKIIRRGRQQTRENTRPERFAVAPVARERHDRQALFQVARGESQDQAALGFGGFGAFLGGGGAGFELGAVVGGVGDGEAEAFGEGRWVGEACEAEDGDFGEAYQNGEAFGWWGEVGEEGV